MDQETSTIDSNALWRRLCYALAGHEPEQADLDFAAYTAGIMPKAEADEFEALLSDTEKQEVAAIRATPLPGFLPGRAGHLPPPPKPMSDTAGAARIPLRTAPRRNERKLVAETDNLESPDDFLGKYGPGQ